MVEKLERLQSSLFNPPASGKRPGGSKNSSTYSFSNRRYWESFAYHLRHDPVSLSVLVEMLGEYQQYRDNVICREALND